MSQKTRNPPSVRYPAQRSLALGSVLLAFALLGAAVMTVWAFQGTGLHWPSISFAGLGWAAAVLAVLHFWWYQFTGHIRWNGQAWSLDVSAQDSTAYLLDRPPEVFIDLQTHLFLRTVPVGRRPVWLWLERSSAPERWMELRRAVYSRAVVHTDSASGGAPANRHGA